MMHDAANACSSNHQYNMIRPSAQLESDDVHIRCVRVFMTLVFRARFAFSCLLTQ
jgi:hypothetical protein